MVRASPDGGALIVEISRPLTAPARAGDLPMSRYDLWLVDLRRGEKTQLTFGERDGSAAWAALWSPDSRRIAYLTTAQDGIPRAAWMDVRSRRGGRLSDAGVDVEVNFGSRSPYFGDGRIWGTWIDNERLLTALLPAGQITSSHRITAPEGIFPRMWAKARDGGTSVIAWDSEMKAICNQDTRLALLGIHRPSVEQTLFTGAVRAVRVAPDRKAAAIVIATGMLDPPAVGRFDREFNFQNLDPRVHTELALLPLSGSPDLRRVAGVREVRFQNEEDIARWTDDSAAVYAPRFDLTEGQPANFCVGAVRAAAGVLDDLKFDCTRVRSRRHAQLLAASLSVAPPKSQQALEDRITETSTAVSLSTHPYGDDIALFSLGQTVAGLWDAKGFGLIDLQTGRVLDRHESKAASVALSAQLRSGVGAAIVQIEGHLRVLRTDGARLVFEDPALPTPSFQPLSLISATNGMVWIDRNSAGQKLWVSDLQGRHLRALMSIEGPRSEAFAGIQARTFPYRLSDGRQLAAVLLLPPNYDASRPYPLILDVYPFRTYQPSTDADAAFKRKISSVDAFAFASRGYVVARPSMPDYVGELSAYEPLVYHTDMIEGLAREAIAAGLTAPGRIGLWGHSNGGYLALATTARSKLISAVVAYSPFPDLLQTVEKPLRLPSLDACAPSRFFGNQIVYAEDPNGRFWRMGEPSFSAFDRYVRNSPIYQMRRDAPATLIIQGEFDGSGTEDSERVYTRLMRLGVPVQLARYYGEGHNFSSPGNIRDRVERELAWFDRHLVRKGM